MPLQTYAAFFRGINVGGHGAIGMADLTRALEALELKGVRAILASGNVVFETRATAPAQLNARIEAMLAEKFGLSSTVMLRRREQMARLLAANPFSAPKLGPQTKIQITFLGQEFEPTAKFPVRLLTKPFELVQVSSTEICSALDMSGTARTPELMKYLEKEFGKNLTTRTWATVEKVWAAMER